MPRLDDLQRDEAYRACCLAITAAGAQRESLYLARLALLLMEEIGDLPRCLAAIDAAARDLPASGGPEGCASPGAAERAGSGHA